MVPLDVQAPDTPVGSDSLYRDDQTRTASRFHPAEAALQDLFLADLTACYHTLISLCKMRETGGLSPKQYMPPVSQKTNQIEGTDQRNRQGCWGNGHVTAKHAATACRQDRRHASACPQQPARADQRKIPGSTGSLLCVRAGPSERKGCLLLPLNHLGHGPGVSHADIVTHHCSTCDFQLADLGTHMQILTGTPAAVPSHLARRLSHTSWPHDHPGSRERCATRAAFGHSTDKGEKRRNRPGPGR
jgi:hypothetical protein